MAQARYTMDVEVRYRWPRILWNLGWLGALCWLRAGAYLGTRRILRMGGSAVRVGPWMLWYRTWREPPGKWTFEEA